MSEVSQGPGWWQAADLKWYPPELHADYVPPQPSTLPPPPKLPPPPTQPPVKKGPARSVWFVLAGLSLPAVAFLRLGPRGIPFAVALVIASVTLAVRSRKGDTGGVIGAVVGIFAVFAISLVTLTHGSLHHKIFHDGPSESVPSPGSGSSGGAAGLSPGQAKITIGGEVQSLTAPVRCSPMGVGEGMSIGGDSGVTVMLGRSDTDSPDVEIVTFKGVAGVDLLRVEPGDSAAHATATKHGNSYTFTGTATGLKQYSSTEVTREFEIDLTCP